ncbi:MAG: hypothetical protein EPN88_13885 [Bacteroidetes bacterium]|nr:MAG: hypothetical protein EPN88_13885 [Bacteroidota bacterium]
MIELFITETAAKNYGSKEEFIVINERVKYFETIEEAKKWIRETYPGEIKSFINDGGWVAYAAKSFRNEDIPVEKWIQQDCIEFREVKPINMDGKEC